MTIFGVSEEELAEQRAEERRHVEHLCRVINQACADLGLLESGVLAKPSSAHGTFVTLVPIVSTREAQLFANRLSELADRER